MRSIPPACGPHAEGARYPSTVAAAPVAPSNRREAGHYKHNSERSASLGSNALWFDARNVNGQCGVCNRWKPGNLAAYAHFLEKKHGPELLQELNKLYQTPRKWTREARA